VNCLINLSVIITPKKRGFLCQLDVLDHLDQGVETVGTVEDMPMQSDRVRDGVWNQTRSEGQQIRKSSIASGAVDQCWLM
jgi:hypothetical protein